MEWRQLAEDVAVLRYPMRALGIDFWRHVTLLRLRGGRIVIHSTADFTPDDAAAIKRFGEPAWLIEATLIHDTFARRARAVFPEIPYLAPAGLEKMSGISTQPLLPPPADWSGEVEVLRIEGLRKVDEHAFFHRASRTLVLADLLFHFPEHARGWTRFFVRRFMGLPRLLGISALFRLMIRDKETFARSMRKLLEWDFAQIVVAHGEPITRDAKSIFAQALRDREIALDGLEIQPARAIASA